MKRWRGEHICTRNPIPHLTGADTICYIVAACSMIDVRAKISLRNIKARICRVAAQLLLGCFLIAIDSLVIACCCITIRSAHDDWHFANGASASIYKIHRNSQSRYTTRFSLRKTFALRKKFVELGIVARTQLLLRRSNPFRHMPNRTACCDFEKLLHTNMFMPRRSS